MHLYRVSKLYLKVKKNFFRFTYTHRRHLVWFLTLYSPYYLEIGSEVKFQISRPQSLGTPDFVSVSSEFISPATLVVISPALAERRTKTKNFRTKGHKQGFIKNVFLFKYKIKKLQNSSPKIDVLN